jgi:hypothetical protein
MITSTETNASATARKTVAGFKMTPQGNAAPQAKCRNQWLFHLPVPVLEQTPTGFVGSRASKWTMMVRANEETIR